MSEEPTSFPDLARDFAAAVENAKTSRAGVLAFVSLQFTTLLGHKTETDDDKRHLTGLMSGLAVYWLSNCASPDFNGEFTKAPLLLHPMFDALQAPQALPFVPQEDVQKITDACLALAKNGYALLEKAGPHDSSEVSVKLKAENREALLALTHRALDFATKCKEYRDGIGFDAKTSKDIAPVKRIELKAGANNA
jgi:hypothetical protein